MGSGPMPGRPLRWCVDSVGEGERMTKILYIEDEAHLREDVADLLEDEGYEVLLAEHGRDGLEMALQHDPNLVICDITMPVMDGYEVVRQLREEHVRFSDTPFLFLSALADRNDILEGMKKGADDYLIKPIDFDLLLGKVEIALRQVRRMQERKERQLAYMAHHDSLTDLANRVLLGERIDRALLQAKRGHKFAIHFLDLDRFKSINDTLGHGVGDELLKAVAERLQGCVRESDTLARVGGDEFAIVQCLTDTSEDAAAMAERVCKALEEPFDLKDHHVIVGTSIGIAIAPKDGQDAGQLLMNADLALYRAKNDGRSQFCFFESEMDEQMKARRALEMDLRQAIEKKEFQLFYQPVINLEQNKTTGFEALVRWNHPKHGFIGPAEFIAVAEDTGLINSIGEWIIQEACKEATTWPQEYRVAINLSPVQIRNENLVLRVISALGATGLAANRLEFEITETVLLQEDERTLETLHQLRDLGARIVMDDFGTGYSSLSYLRSFPFDKVKIDRCFVKDLAMQEDAVAIIRAVSSLAKSLGMTTTAEGVETQEQLAIVREEGCTEVQGYLFSRPGPANQVSRHFDSVRLVSSGGAA